MTLIARFMGPTWGASGADRTQAGPMLAPWTLRSGELSDKKSIKGPVFIYKDNLSTYCDSNNENMPGVIYIRLIVIVVRLDFYIELAPIAYNLDRGINSHMVFPQEPFIVSYRSTSWQSDPIVPSTYDQSTLLLHPRIVPTDGIAQLIFFVNRNNVKHARVFKFDKFWKQWWDITKNIRNITILQIAVSWILLSTF